MLHFFKTLLTVTLILYAYAIRSQQSCNLLFQHNTDTIKKWQSILQQKNLAETQTFKGEFSDQKKWLYQERLNAIMEHFDKPELITDTIANNYISAILAKLQPAIKALKSNGTTVYVSRSAVPNAYTSGLNTVFLNAGLLTRIENEAQLAFILCHEIAHIFLNHGEEAADQYLASIQSKEFKEKVSAIKKMEFGQGRAIEELFKKFSFDSRRHSRFKETAADSLAIIWLKQTGFNVKQVVNCLALLDSIDIDRCDTKAVFEKNLNAAEHPVNANYFGTSRRSVFGASVFSDDTESLNLIDSLRTHPDCKQRMLYAGTMITDTEYNSGENFLVDSLRFFGLRHRLHTEVIEFALNYEKTSRGFFYAIEQLATDGATPSIATSISNALNKLYEAQKNHTLGKIVDLPNPSFFTKSYNQLLYFIQNASLTDLAMINYYFTASVLKKYTGCKELAVAMATCAENLGKPDEAAHWRNLKP